MNLRVQIHCQDEDNLVRQQQQHLDWRYGGGGLHDEYLSIYLSIYLFIYLSFYLAIYLVADESRDETLCSTCLINVSLNRAVS